MKWLLLGLMVSSTVASDLLQSSEMKKAGETPIGGVLGVIFRKRLLILAVACMAVSFFAFLQLLAIADLSFAVPASAATYVLETVLAKLLLREDVNWQRWAGAGLVASGVFLLAL
jgi:drug/metabolite transporter (DMT)-like permease